MGLDLAVMPAILGSLCHDATAWPILPSPTHVPQRLLGTDLKVICTLATAEPSNKKATVWVFVSFFMCSYNATELMLHNAQIRPLIVIILDITLLIWHTIFKYHFPFDTFCGWVLLCKWSSPLTWNCWLWAQNTDIVRQKERKATKKVHIVSRCSSYSCHGIEFDQTEWMKIKVHTHGLFSKQLIKTVTFVWVQTTNSVFHTHTHTHDKINK